MTKGLAFCRYWSCPHWSRSGSCKPVAGGTTGEMSTRSFCHCTRGTPHVRWRFGDPGMGLCNDSYLHDSPRSPWSHLVYA